MAEVPIWTDQTVAAISPYFEVVTPPMTISVDGLEPHEAVHVRSAPQGGVGDPVPFRSRGNVQVEYNNTKINILTRGWYCLELEKDPKNPINAHRN